MKTLAAIAIAVLVLLAGCAGVQWGGGRPTQNPAFGMGSVSDALAASTLPPAKLYRDNPDEKPTMVKVEVAAGKFVDVEVWHERCRAWDGSGTAVSLEYPTRAVFLCGDDKAANHELAHQAGMKHEGWQRGGGGMCAKVIAAGYKTGYVAGQTICKAENGFEWVEKR